MNSKGFTLVELMVVIVIIGVLAGLALPKFASISAKAKASEVPPIMAQIGKAESIFYDESNKYASIPYSNWQNSLNTTLGVDIQPQFFSYYVDPADDISFKAHAKVEKTFGTLSNTSIEVTIDQIEQIEYVNDDDDVLKSYLRSWDQ